ncbi:peroxide stress protein YaaA [Corynebacterium sp. FDAARGOS 1242]|uniref:peroxide stress protein YaaA n=1 Tax=Corynebacterium sp. FDAARGOS 1242 TaxID=2778078 RepID=UPI001951E7C5|nr:peroxide stress protein YaaA [Corynebacterium sp. FDAARGOS 1242]QRP98571.1 peroxide stress protein YaaA [Corynebacterium sp. FDAARGOS 1242]
MLIILPPSETKAHGGSGAAVNWNKLSFPALNPIRQEIAAELSALDVDEALEVLKLSEKLRGEAESNRELASSPTMPALERFTGVLYDALDAPTLPPEARSYLAVGDALFGLVRADDLIPHYRLSGSTKLGGRTLKSRWGTAITDELRALVDAGEFLLDMRSGTYQQLGKLKDAATVRVETVQEDGSRKVVSHFNKHYKGELARVLALKGESVSTLEDAARVAQESGMSTELRSTELVLVV